MRKALAALALALAASGCSGHSSSTSTSTSTSSPPRDRAARGRGGSSCPRSACRGCIRGPPGLRPDRRPEQQPPPARLALEAGRLAGREPARPRRCLLHARLPVGDHERGVQRHAGRVSLKTHARVWQYGHSGVAGSSPGYLNTPDDAYRLPSGITTVADIQNCRIVQLGRADRWRASSVAAARTTRRAASRARTATRRCPTAACWLPRSAAGSTGWAPTGSLAWSIRSPVPYPSDAQLLPDGRVLVASFAIPGRIVIVDRCGRVSWSFGSASGPDRLAKPSLAVRLPNGLIAANDDYNHRVIVIDPRTKRIVWQYGHTGVSGTGPGYLEQTRWPRPAAGDRPRAGGSPRPAVKAEPAVRVVRLGSLPQPVSKLSAVALPGGRVLALGGLVGGSSTSQVLLGSPAHLRPVTALPVPTHDAAAALVGGRVYLFGGGEAVSTDTVLRVDPGWRTVARAGSLGEPLSDLGAATVGGKHVSRRRLHRLALRDGSPPLPARRAAPSW